MVRSAKKERPEGPEGGPVTANAVGLGLGLDPLASWGGAIKAVGGCAHVLTSKGSRRVCPSRERWRGLAATRRRSRKPQTRRAARPAGAAGVGVG